MICGNIKRIQFENPLLRKSQVRSYIALSIQVAFQFFNRLMHICKADRDSIDLAIVFAQLCTTAYNTTILFHRSQFYIMIYT